MLLPLCLIAAFPHPLGSPQLQFVHAKLQLADTPRRLLASPLDAGPTADLTAIALQSNGAHSLTTIGLVGTELEIHSLTDLFQFGYRAVPNLVQADLDNDGVLDACMSSHFFPQYYFGNGDLSLAGGAVFPTAGGYQHDIGFTDIDGDGFVDSALLVDDLGGWFLDYGLNNGNGTDFSAGFNFTFAPGTPSSSARLLFADLDGRGGDSTLVTGGTGLARSAWPSGSASNDLLLPGSFTEVAAADFDGVNGLDLAVCEPDQNSIHVLLNDGSGEFPSALRYAVGRRPESLTTGDFDGDGHIDLAVANRRGHDVTLLCGDGSGAFEICGVFPVGSTPVDTSAGDLDGNGKLDLAVACSGSRSISVLLGQ